ncbi:MAG: DUF3828 domain-containing protein [Betaproteobacteria bacterium]|nr:DUF3828 domain-containing protein [Betaproteobacteria bacterium]
MAAHAESPAAAIRPVVQLYSDFAASAVLKEPKPQWIIDQTDAVWSRYFSDELVRLLRRDLECTNRTKEICRLDFDPIWASQDPAATQLRIVAGKRDREVDVSFVYPGSQHKKTLRYEVSKHRGKWRTDDITYVDIKYVDMGIGLRELLQRPWPK